MPVYAWLCLDMSEYALIYWNKGECAKICQNRFCFTFLHFRICFTFSLLLEHVVTYLNVYRKLEVIVWRKMRLISWRNSFKVFSIATGSISFAFCFRPHIFLVRFKFAVTFQGRGRWGPWILIYCTDAMLINKGFYNAIRKLRVCEMRAQQFSTCELRHC